MDALYDTRENRDVVQITYNTPSGPCCSFRFITMSNEQAPKPTILELDRFTFYAPVEGNKRASLCFSMREGYPRLTVWTRTQSDNEGKGVINIPFDILHFNVFLDRLTRIARSETVPVKERALVKHFPRNSEGKITGDPEVTGEIWYGKNEHGVVWISAQQPNRPKIIFEINVSNFHEFQNSKGEPISKSEGSIAVTTSMIHILRTHFTNSATSFRDTSQPRPKTGPYSSRNKQPNSEASKQASSMEFAKFDNDVEY